MTAPHSQEQLTLDTCHVLDYFRPETQGKAREWVPEIRRLFELHKQGRVSLAITEYVHDDLGSDPELNQWLAELHVLDVVDVIRPMEVGNWRLGVNPLGSGQFVSWYLLAHKLVRERLNGSKRGKCLDDRDWGHLHSHLLSKRDLFITKDEGILELRAELLRHFQIRVLHPKDYLVAIEGSDP